MARTASLRIAGVVHRPGADEKLLSQLTVDGRKRETGLFEKAIRLGTKNEPAGIDIAGISAKMADGVLIVKAPKVEVEHKKRDVPIAGSASQSPDRNEKDLLFDADTDMYNAPVEQAPEPTEVNMDMEKAMHEHHKEKEAEIEPRDNRSETVGREEQLPLYEESANDESDWEKAGSDEEGDYVKINVRLRHECHLDGKVTTGIKRRSWFDLNDAASGSHENKRHSHSVRVDWTIT